MLHAFLHLAVPALLAWSGTLQQWWRRYLWLLAGLLVDADHLLASPIHDAQRCSMGFHPLHTWPAVLIYAVLTAYKPTRWLGYGLLLHMALDALDCLGMTGGSAQLANFFRWPGDGP